MGLFYFSRHGSAKPDEANPNFLIPASTNISAQEVFNAPRGQPHDFGGKPTQSHLSGCLPQQLSAQPNQGRIGSAASEEGREPYEKKAKVKLSDGFWMAKPGLRQAQWRALMEEGHGLHCQA